ncbi:MAG: hypothetical protein V2A73_03315 [Pseudomonadota bacterium]
MAKRAPRTPKEVIKEIQHRYKESGEPALRPKPNKKDWLYPAGVKVFGTWKAAVEAAGYKYRWAASRIAPYTATEAKKKIQAIVAAGKRPAAKNDWRLKIAAQKYYGSWKKALEAAGCATANLLWPEKRVLDMIRERNQKGLSVNSTSILRECRHLYTAARHRFGSWKKALELALGRDYTKTLRG